MSTTDFVSTTVTIANGEINKELEVYQHTLENLGFKVACYEDMVNYQAAQVLAAEKGYVILRASCTYKGKKHFSLSLKRDGYEKKVPMSIYSLNHAISMVQAIQATVR